MAHYKGPDPKREQFRRYLEKAGVVDSLTSVLVSLYEQQEKPNNALEFVKQQLGAVGQTSEDAEALQQEVINLRQKCARLAGENKELKAKVSLQWFEVPASHLHSATMTDSKSITERQ
uniref:MYC binding protein n=1 Tax=Haplochromis burtoni TaxID=8153 RepID=A0A3Q2VC12_HAPBU